jgi:hypothetical protein
MAINFRIVGKPEVIRDSQPSCARQNCLTPGLPTKNPQTENLVETKMCIRLSVDERHRRLRVQ